MREQLMRTLDLDETAALLLTGARPREVEQSGEVACERGSRDSRDATDRSSSSAPSSPRQGQLSLVKPSVKTKSSKAS